MPQLRHFLATAVDAGAAAADAAAAAAAAAGADGEADTADGRECRPRDTSSAAADRMVGNSWWEPRRRASPRTGGRCWARRCLIDAWVAESCACCFSSDTASFSFERTQRRTTPFRSWNPFHTTRM